MHSVNHYTFYLIHVDVADRNVDSEPSRRANNNCEPANPANNVTQRLNNLLQNSGPDYVLNLCPQETYFIQAPIAYAHPNQEISTLGYPTGSDRAILTVSGPIFSNGTGHTNAVDGTCKTCSGVRLRNIQVCRTSGYIHCFNVLDK